MTLGGPHRQFVVSIGRDHHSYWRNYRVYIGLWQRASCAEGELAWLFDWSWSTRWFPRLYVHGSIELIAFGRAWIWRR